MKFGLDTLLEKITFKGLVAGAVLLVVAAGLIKAVLPLFFDNRGETIARPMPVPAAAIDSKASIQEQVREAAPLVSNAVRPAPAPRSGRHSP